METLNKIETLEWKRHDTEWVSKREQEWLQVEFWLGTIKPLKKCMKPIRDYFMTGKMPNWKAFRDWDNPSRHLDLFVFLWLHPSRDRERLSRLCELYTSSTQITPSDIDVGVANLLDSQIIRATAPYKTMQRFNFPYLSGKGELLFDVILMDDKVCDRLNYLKSRPGFVASHIFGSYQWFPSVKKWLKLEKLLPIQMEMLLQYDQPLQWWFKGMEEDKDFFTLRGIEYSQDVFPLIAESLRLIYNFDFEAEGPSPRSDFVRKVLPLLDQCSIAPEVKAIWEDVKAGS
ncbi:hypothetical protein SAMN02745866_02972 [Alteromonadaceae bacterium Bs31]|nr:hypothetical protein SAMN02745866_02972 [Alteromonadaceae bacterium Bs31]